MDDERLHSWPAELAVAALTGVTTACLPVHRWSPVARWTLHGGIGSAVGAATAYVVSRPAKPTDTGDAPSERPGPGTVASIGVVLAVVVAGTSRAGEGVDAWIERGLARRGVRRPRAWIGVGAAGVSLAMSVAERRQAARGPEPSAG